MDERSLVWFSNTKATDWRTVLFSRKACAFVLCISVRVFVCVLKTNYYEADVRDMLQINLAELSASCIVVM